jgi:transcriptional regulator with XRE-family HTH domain
VFKGKGGDLNKVHSDKLFYLYKKKKMIGRKIKMLRESKNYTQEYMASNLNISQNTYSRIENENVKISTDRLKEIASLLEVPSEYLISDQSPSLTFNNNNNKIDKFYGHVSNLSEGEKDIWLITIKQLENQIKYLQSENERLLSLLERLSLK